MSERPRSVALVEDDDLRVGWIEGEGEDLWLSFTGISHGMGGLQPEEFAGTATGGRAGAVFVTDKRCSWMNAVDLDRLAAAVGPVIAGKRLFAIGNSMGGFAAVVASKLFPVETCLAFAPQFSVAPGVIPEETRWSELRGAIGIWRFVSLADQFNDRTRYVLLNGDDEADARHWRRMPDRANVHNLVFDGADHGLARVLKADGRLASVVADARAGAGDLFERPEVYGARRVQGLR
jgi:hypothetical protein